MKTIEEEEEESSEQKEKKKVGKIRIWNSVWQTTMKKRCVATPSTNDRVESSRQKQNF